MSPMTRKVTTNFNILSDSTTSKSSSMASSRQTSNDNKSGIWAPHKDTVLPLTTSKINNQHSPSFNRTVSQKHKMSTLAQEQENESPIDQLLKQISQQKEKPDIEHGKLKYHIDMKEGQPQDAAHAEMPSDIQKTSAALETVDDLRKQLEDAQAKLAAMDLKLAEQSSTVIPSLKCPNGTDVELRDVTQQLLEKLEDVPVRSNNAAYGGDAGFDNDTITPLKPHDLLEKAWSGNGTATDPVLASHEPASFSGWNEEVPHHYRPSALNRAPLTLQPQRAYNQHFDGFPACSSYSSSTFDPGQYDQNYRGVGGQFARWPTSKPGWDAHLSYPGAPTDFSPPITPTSLTSGDPGPTVISYQSHIPGTGLSPTAAEFNVEYSVGNPRSGINPWNVPNAAMGAAAPQYMAPVEPINYRRLLDRNTTCNWHYIVDKIVCSNDQQASIFLQQKLKISSPEQKFELVEAIIYKAYPLMINRFGNFLIQRCFEHGTPEQVVAIANAIRGKTLDLSMDAFGCHVVQKAFDVVPEQYKAIMVHELLRRIPETVVHRYACHVWQKLFELRWSDSPPQIMKYVNEALRGMWHEVALGETGSLVVQNIFENCLEEDKRPCIGEVLANIDIVSHGQFGNWCIQHICEHGAPGDKSCAIEHVLQYATEYSTDQFASKVVEKCLKVAGSDFLDRYLDKICEGRPDRPRMPLIDIAGDQYGNYLVQFILIHADAHHREAVSMHVRKHMVSLRGSKFGSRVAMLCTNPTIHTRPGPPMAMPLNSHERFFLHGNGNTNNNSMPMNNHSFGNNMHRQGFR